LATNLCNKTKIRARATAAAAVVVVAAAAAAAAAVAVAAVKRIPTAQVAVAAAVVKKVQNPTEESHESPKKLKMTPAVLQMTADLRI